MKWTVYLPVYASVCVEVEAPDKQSAIDLAYRTHSDIPSLCDQCSQIVELAEWCEDGADADEITKEDANAKVVSKYMRTLDAICGKKPKA